MCTGGVVRAVAEGCRQVAIKEAEAAAAHGHETPEARVHRTGQRDITEGDLVMLASPDSLLLSSVIFKIQLST